MWQQIKEKAKKVFCWLGTVFTAIFAVLFVKEVQKKEKEKDPVLIDDVEEVNEKASKKRAEAIARISNTPARDVAEQYGSVCDTIAEGKDRFKKRCTEWTEYEDIRR